MAQEPQEFHVGDRVLYTGCRPGFHLKHATVVRVQSAAETIYIQFDHCQGRNVKPFGAWIGNLRLDPDELEHISPPDPGILDTL